MYIQVRSDAGSGVTVADTGNVTLDGCTLKGSGKCGLLVFDGGNVMCKDCTILDNELYGLVVQNGGCAVLEGDDIKGNRYVDCVCVCLCVWNGVNARFWSVMILREIVVQMFILCFYFYWMHSCAQDMHAYAYTHILYIYIYIYTHTYMYIYIYTHTHTDA